MSARKGGRCLVVQLAQLGDTIQSLMALRAVKQLYPELEISFVAKENFSYAAERIPWIDKVYTLPVSDILEVESLGMAKVAEWLKPIVEKPWKFVVNWSYSESSSFLTALVPAEIKLGFSRRSDCAFSCEDGWSYYVQAIVQGEVKQNIHLTDILTTQLLTALQIHLGEPRDDGNIPVTSKEFFSLRSSDSEKAWTGRNTARKWVAFQLGSDAGGKDWGADSWGAFGVEMLRRHPEISIVLLGASTEQTTASQVLEYIDRNVGIFDRVLSLVGRTDFDLWASVVGSCHWVLAADTPVIHLASVLGTRVLNISVGAPLLNHSGPYGNGHYVIAPRDAKPIDAEIAYAVWSYANSEWSHRRKKPISEHFEFFGLGEALRVVDVYRSKIRPSVQGGGVVFEPMIPRAMTLDQWLSTVMGQIARSWYCGWVAPVGLELSRDTIDSSLVKSLRELEDSSKVLLTLTQQATQTALGMARKSSQMRSEFIMSLKDKAELDEMANRLRDIDQLMERTASVQEAFKAFTQMLKVMMHNLRGKKVSELARETAECYRQVGEGVELFRQWLQHTLSLAKPMEIKPRPTMVSLQESRT